MKKDEICVLIDSIETRNEVVKILENNGYTLSNLFKKNIELNYLHFDKMWFFSNKFLDKKQIMTFELQKILTNNK